MKSNHNNSLPPYGEFVPKLLKSIFKALSVLCVNAKSEICVTSQDLDEKLRECFIWLDKEYFPIHRGTNRHLTLNLRSKKSTKNNPIRIVELVKQSFIESQQEAKKRIEYKTDNAIFLPSPLYILYQALTVPEEPQSRAYASIACRTLLFQYAKIHPKTTVKIPEGWKPFDEKDVMNAHQEFLTYAGIVITNLHQPNQASSCFSFTLLL